jgi:hypothetical protein
VTAAGAALLLSLERCIGDAAIVGSQISLVRAFLMRAIELGGPGETVHYAGQALNELEALRRTLRDHFDRLGAPPSTVLNGP